MTFDEQLKGAFDTITDLLREEISRQVQVVTVELGESAHADRAQAVAEAREAAMRDADQREATAVALAEARGREQGEARGREQGEARGREEGEALGREQGEARGREQGEALGREQGQAEGRREAEEAGRAAIDAALAARLAEVPGPDGASNERLVEAVRSISRARSLSEILDTLLSGVVREAARAGVLLVRGERLQGWRFVGFEPAIDAQSFVLSFDDAGLIAEAVRTNAAVNNDGGGSEISSAPAFAALPSGRECLAVPVALSDQVVAILYADQGLAKAESVPAWRDAVEVLVRHAARSLEAHTAFKAARALMARSHPPEAMRSGASEGAGAEEDASARRYARLLVSEIRLYHEAAVVAGRRDRDLGTRLGGEIARARVLYEQRVPPHVRQRADYFRDELVRTLADGDAGLLEVRS